MTGAVAPSAPRRHTGGRYLAFEREGGLHHIAVQRATETTLGVDLVGQVRHFLRQQGGIAPRPIVGGIVAQDQANGRIHIFWQLPGPPAFGWIRRPRCLSRYERLLRSWGMT